MTARPRQQRRRRRPDWVNAALFVFLGATIIFIIAPIVVVVVNSFNASQFSAFPPQEFSLRWYERLFSIENFWQATKLSLIVAAASTAIALAVGTLTAVVFVRHSFPGKQLLWSFYLAPAIIPKVAIGLSMFVLFLSIRAYGSVASLILVHVIIVLPFAMVTLASTLANVDPRLEEAARDLGASPIRAFLSVTLPQMTSGFVTAGVLVFVLSFDELEATIFVARHDMQTLPIAMFNYMERWQDPVIAALSTVLVGLSLVVALTVALLRGRDLASTLMGRR